MSHDFKLHLSWEKPGEPSGSAADATWGSLTATVDGQTVWGSVEPGKGLRWTWVELLEFLAEVWPWLQWEEGWPPGISPRDPTEFDVRARGLLESLPKQGKEDEANQLFEFRQRHDLACALQGAIVPSLWIVREGAGTWVAGKAMAVRLPFASVLSTLADVGDTIAARLRSLEDARAKEAVADWKTRIQNDPISVVSISTRLRRQELLALVGGDPGKIAGDFEVGADALDNARPTELMAAARMVASTVDIGVVKSLMAIVRSMPRIETPILEALSTEAQQFIFNLGPRDIAEQGFELGRWFREKHQLTEDQCADADKLLNQWGVRVVDLPLGTTSIDAIACWGPKHGPAVVVNNKGIHKRTSSLAHEIAHLLVDRADALPLAEVLGEGSAPRAAESRANAFSAELLIPRAVAGREMARTQDAGKTLVELSARYRASQEMIAWQAYNSGIPCSWATFNLLKSKVSRPQYFLWRVMSGR